MPNARRPAPATAAAAAALLLVFAATWIVLDRTEGRPGWLRVEAPAVAVVGRPLEVRVTLTKRAPVPVLVSCTLQRANAERRGWGFLAAAGPARPAAAGETLVFVFDVPDRPGTAFAFPLIFLSPTGKWEDGARAATAEYLPVVREAGPTVLARRRVFPYPTAAQESRRRARAVRTGPAARPSVWVHPVLAGLLAAAAACAAAAGLMRGGPDGADNGRARRVWLVLAVALAAAAGLEISGLAGHLTAWGRRWAEARGLYEMRKPVQEMLIAATAAGSLGLFILFIKAVRRAGASRSLLWAAIGLADYLAVSFVSVLSFHAVDVARGLAWHGLSPVDALRGAGVVAALAAAAAAARRRAGGGTPVT